MKRFLRRRRKQCAKPECYWATLASEGQIKEMLSIETHSMKKPWTENEILAALDEKRVIARCAEWKNRIVSFSIYELRKDETIVLLKLAVHPKFRRRHIGRALVRDIVRRNADSTLIAPVYSGAELANDPAVARKFLASCDSLNGVRQNAIRITP